MEKSKLNQAQKMSKYNPTPAPNNSDEIDEVPPFLERAANNKGKVLKSLEEAMLFEVGEDLELLREHIDALPRELDAVMLNKIKDFLKAQEKLQKEKSTEITEFQEEKEKEIKALINTAYNVLNKEADQVVSSSLNKIREEQRKTETTRANLLKIQLIIIVALVGVSILQVVSVLLNIAS